MSRKALVVIDMQNEWQEKLSPYYLGDISRVVIKQNKLIDFCRSKGFDIIFTAHIEKEGKEFAAKTRRVKILKAVHRQKGDAVVKKHKISPFYKTTMDRKIKDCDLVVICGVLTNLCVRSMAEGAYDRDKQVVIIDDGCRTFDFGVHEFTLRDLQDTREEIRVMKADDFIRKMQ